MKAYIQSKTGNYSVKEADFPGIGTLAGVLKALRRAGGYEAEHRDKPVFVPFEEIEYVGKAQ